MKSALAVFAKYPTPGRVKTRLARSLGEAEAVSIYERLLGHFHEHTLAKLAPESWDVTWYGDPFTAHQSYRDLFAFTSFGVALQNGGDLGERMRQALSEQLLRHPRAIVVGTDCLDVTPPVLESAASALADHDLVVGPAGDGGYYLLGLKRAAPELFTDMPWSTDQVLKLTLERAQALGWKTKRLSVLRDIDDKEDWKALGWRCDEENESIKKLRRRKTSPG